MQLAPTGAHLQSGVAHNWQGIVEVNLPCEVALALLSAAVSPTMTAGQPVCDNTSGSREANIRLSSTGRER